MIKEAIGTGSTLDEAKEAALKALGAPEDTDVKYEVIEREKAVLKAQALEEGKPAQIVEKMVEGRIKSFYDDNCLLNQKFVKDPSKTIEQLVVEATATIGEKIAIRRFVRFEMGEGLQKKNENLADEVAAQVARSKN